MAALTKCYCHLGPSGGVPNEGNSYLRNTYGPVYRDGFSNRRRLGLIKGETGSKQKRNEAGNEKVKGAPNKKPSLLCFEGKWVFELRGKVQFLSTECPVEFNLG